MTQQAGIDAASVERTRQWLAAAADPQSFDTPLFAKLIAAREVRGEWALLGLSREQWDGLVSRHFAAGVVAGVSEGTIDSQDASRASANAHTQHLLPEDHVEFVASMRVLLLRYANPAVSAADAQCLATIIAHACLRPDHLWRDLGLAGRDEVTAMLERYFPTLVVLNVENLRWKKFLARQLALSLGREPGPAPGCPGCEDYGFCFPDRA